MKTLIFSLVLMLFAGLTKAQEITELKEARVVAPLSSEVNRTGNEFSYKVKETSVKEFEKDPLLFMNSHFNVKDLISQDDGEGESYFVTFKSSKGNLQAKFNSEGDLVRSKSTFKNIVLPRELIHQLYKDHKGWAMVKNVHVTKGNDGIVNRDFYKIRLENGRAHKNVIFEAPMRGLEVAGN